jgi:hypothetical protein
MALSFDELELESAEYIPAREVMTTASTVGTVTSTVHGLLGTVDAGETVGGATGLVNGTLGTAGLDDTVGQTTSIAYGAVGTVGGIGVL